jgi:hypothetical protein
MSSALCESRFALEVAAGARNTLQGAEEFGVREAVAHDHQVGIASRLVGRWPPNRIRRPRESPRTNGFRALRRGSARPIVFKTIFRGSEKAGQSASGSLGEGVDEVAAAPKRGWRAPVVQSHARPRATAGYLPRQLLQFISDGVSTSASADEGYP